MKKNNFAILKHEFDFVYRDEKTGIIYHAVRDGKYYRITWHQNGVVQVHIEKVDIVRALIEKGLWIVVDKT